MAPGQRTTARMRIVGRSPVQQADNTSLGTALNTAENVSTEVEEFRLEGSGLVPGERVPQVSAGT
jgi:hypothetical protein